MKNSSKTPLPIPSSSFPLKRQGLDLDYLKKIVDILVPVITTLGLAIAGGYSLFEYGNRQETRQQDKTLELYMKQIDTLKDTRTALDIFYHPQERKKLLGIIQVNSSNTDQTKLAQAYHDFIIKFSQDKYEEIKIMIDFYEGVANCVETQVCDQETANKLFKREGKEFFTTYFPVICELRSTSHNPDIALKLEQFYHPRHLKSNKSQVCNYLAQINTPYGQ